jgi:type III secretory pathway component EscT
MPQASSLVDALSATFSAVGVDPRSWALGFARAVPAVTLVPAFGLAAVPVPTRLVLGLSLGLCVAPALAGRVDASSLFVVALAREVLVGLPVALLAALSMYVAVMAGGLIDDLRGGRESVTLPVLPEQLPPVSALLGLLSAIAFLETGGAARVVSSLSMPALSGRFAWSGVVAAFAGAVDLALAIAAPLAVACVLLEAASALIVRAAAPAFIAPVLAPVKSIALLAVLALVLERLTELLALLARASP